MFQLTVSTPYSQPIFGVASDQAGGTFLTVTASGLPIMSSDFDADGLSDILFQNNSGQALVWEMQGTAVAAASSVGPNPGPNWRVKATGDVSGDGHADIVWQNVDGDALVWATNGFGVIASADLGDPGQDWHVRATGDFNHDGRSDILWQDAEGEVVIWAMNGGV